MKCPTCTAILSPHELGGHDVHRCEDCCGMWFEEATLGHVVQATAPQDFGEPMHSDENISFDCPRCQTTLKSTNYAHDSGVWINKCPACAGTWLKAGQLNLIANYRVCTPARNALADTMATEMQAASRWTRARGVLHSRLLSGVVASSYLAFVLLAGADGRIVLRLIGFLILPLSCIWFSSGLGQLKGISFGLFRPRITSTTPGDFVAIAGWLLLFSPLATLFVAWLN